MSTPDITKAISSNDIKNGASLLLLNKAGIEVLFDSSRDTEQGLEALANETNNRFNDRDYYFPSTSSGGGNPFNQNLNTTNSPTFNKISVSSGIVFTSNNLAIGNSIISNMVVNSLGEGPSLSNGSQIEVALAKTVISNQIINSLGGGGSDLSTGSLVEIGDGKTVMAHQVTNSLDGGSSVLTGRSQIEVNSSGVLIGNKVTNNLDGNSLSSFNGWIFDFTDRNLTLPSGSILSETNNTISLAPPTAASGQSLVIRPTRATWSITSNSYIVYGSPITISVTLQSWSYFGTANYVISGTGVTEQSLGRALTGKLTFSNTSAPETENITWTIPSNSDISQFTLTLTSVDGTRPGPEVADANLYPALYYNFEESNGMPTGQFITVTNNGISSSEHSHVHLVAGDPSTVDIYLGDDDQYIKIEKNDGDVVIGTSSNTHHWTFDKNGKLTLPGGSAQVVVENDYGVRIGTAGTNVAPNNQIKIGGAQHALEIFGGPPGYSWKFDTNGELTLPASGSITFPNNTTQTSAGIPSNTGLVPNSVSITNMVSMSQANYDALVTKDSSTLYVIS